MASAAGPTGYVRLAHLSPDTPDVDVYLSAVGSSAQPQKFAGVGYGDMSAYLKLPVGTYAVAMRGAGAPASSPAVLTTNVTVQSGKAYTVAGVGHHADLGLKVIDDDLSAPPAGEAKVRVIQASVRAPVLSVSEVGGSTIANGVTFASTTPYVAVEPGQFGLHVASTSGSPATTLSTDLGANRVYSLLVLDARSGGLTSQLRLDAAGNTAGVGSVAAGAGGSQPSPVKPWLIGAAALVAIGAAGFAGYWFRRSSAR